MTWKLEKLEAISLYSQQPGPWRQSPSLISSVPLSAECCWQDSLTGRSLDVLICPMGIEELPCRVIENEMIQFMGSGWPSAWLTISSSEVLANFNSY